MSCSAWMLLLSVKPPTLEGLPSTCSVWASLREARIPARATLVDLWPATESSKELCPGVMAVPRRTSLESTPRSTTIWTGLRTP
uniref:Secreted protein n=1 Tax=Rhinopithecus roxellana TaxID=61622 RepID=A0A2K6RP26_RHIRO